MLGSLVGQTGLLCRIYDIFCISAWSKHACYVMTVALNCHSISTKIVLIVSFNFEHFLHHSLHIGSKPLHLVLLILLELHFKL